MLVKNALRIELKTISIQSDISHAAKMLLENGMNGIAVMDENNEFVGLLSSDDVIKSLMPDVEEIYQTNISYSAMNEYFIKNLGQKSSQKIKYFTAKSDFRIEADDPIVKAAAIILNNKIASLPVFNKGVLVGILYKMDILEILLGSNEGDYEK